MDINRNKILLGSLLAGQIPAGISLYKGIKEKNKGKKRTKLLEAMERSSYGLAGALTLGHAADNLVNSFRKDPKEVERILNIETPGKVRGTLLASGIATVPSFVTLLRSKLEKDPELKEKLMKRHLATRMILPAVGAGAGYASNLTKI